MLKKTVNINSVAKKKIYVIQESVFSLLFIIGNKNPNCDHIMNKSDPVHIPYSLFQ